MRESREMKQKVRKKSSVSGEGGLLQKESVPNLFLRSGFRAENNKGKISPVAFGLYVLKLALKI